MKVAPAVVEALNLNPFEAKSNVADTASAFDAFGLKKYETGLNVSLEESQTCQSAIPVADLYRTYFGENPQ